MKKKYTIAYKEIVISQITVTADSEEHAYELAEEAWCDYDDDEWDESRTVVDVEMISVENN